MVAIAKFIFVTEELPGTELADSVEVQEDAQTSASSNEYGQTGPPKQ